MGRRYAKQRAFVVAATTGSAYGVVDVGFHIFLIIRQN
jgi:hypothetical protein